MKGRRNGKPRGIRTTGVDPQLAQRLLRYRTDNEISLIELNGILRSRGIRLSKRRPYSSAQTLSRVERCIPVGLVSLRALELFLLGERNG